MDLYAAYLLNLEVQREWREQRHWERLVKQAESENRLAASRTKPQEKKAFWARARKRVTD